MLFFSTPPRTLPSTLSLHDALPILVVADAGFDSEDNHRTGRLDMGVRTIIPPEIGRPTDKPPPTRFRDRKSTRLNSSHEWISYAVFCLKKKRERKPTILACHTQHRH